MLKFAIIREEKTPPDRRVVFSPKHLKQAKNQFPEAHFKVQQSDIRIFRDEEYQNEGFQVSQDISDCDVMIGVKEVPIKSLIPNKKYFFFSFCFAHFFFFSWDFLRLCQCVSRFQFPNCVFA